MREVTGDGRDRPSPAYRKLQVNMQALTLQAYQEMIDQWVRTTGVRYFSELTNLGILMEETGEVARIMTRTYGDQSYKSPDSRPDLADELADNYTLYRGEGRSRTHRAAKVFTTP